VSAVSAKFAASISHIAPVVGTLLAAFLSIVGDGKGTPRPRHGVQHQVETTGRPVFARSRRLDPDKLKIAEAEFRSLEASGIDKFSLFISTSYGTPSKTDPGAHAVIIADLTLSPSQTATLFLLFKIFQPIFKVADFSPV
jgi:hypothetical protein